MRVARQAESALKAAGIAEPEARITLERQTGESKYESAAEAAEHLGQADLSAVTRITLNAGQPWKDLGLYVFFHKGVSLIVEGQGDAHLFVRGIADDLTQQLEKGDRTVPHEFSITLALSMVSLLVGVGLLVGSRLGLPAGLQWTLYGVQAIAFLSLIWLLARSFVVPQLALVPEGGQSRDQRWGRKAAGLGKWLLTLLAGAVLSQLIRIWLT